MPAGLNHLLTSSSSPWPPPVPAQPPPASPANATGVPSTRHILLRGRAQPLCLQRSLPNTFRYETLGLAPNFAKL